MTLPSSGALVLGTQSGGNSINSEFGYGNDMASYQGVYYGKGGQEYRFPVSGNQISMGGSLSPGDAGFYSTYKITGGSAYFGGSQNYVIPVYNTITITVVGGQGGQAGYNGTNACGYPCGDTGGGGGPGGSSSFGGYVASGGGPGGGAGSDGGGGSYGPTVTNTFTNPVQGGSGPTSGSTLYVTVGGGGSGGSGGKNCFLYYGTCISLTSASGGNGGGSGYVSISWS